MADHSQNKLIEQRLADERSLLRTLIDNLPDAVYVKDRESRFVLCNREVLRRKAVGSLEEIVGRTDFDFYPPDLAQNVYADEQNLMRTGRPTINKERCVIDKVTGRPTWNLTTKVPLRDAANEIVGLVGIGRDITERKQAEEAYHAIVDHSLQGLIVIQNMRIVFANEAMAKISGYAVEEMLRVPAEQLRDFVHPLDREMVWRHHQARLSGESLPERYEFRVVRKDGTIRWLEIITSRVEYQGAPAIQAACIDATERRRAQEALCRSEARNLALLNANPDLMFRFSRGGVFLDCKPPKEEAVSVSPSQFVGRHLDEVFPAEIARTLMRHIQAAIETGQVQTLEYNLSGTESEGGDFECRLVACAEQEAVAIVRDISDRRRAERLARLQRDVAIRLSSLSDLKEGLRYCLEAAVRTSQMDCGSIYTLDEHTGRLEQVVHLGLSQEFTAHTAVYPATSRKVRIVLDGEPVYALYEELGLPIGPVQKAERLRAVAIIPIKDGGQAVACLDVGSHTSDEVPQWSRIVLETIAAQIGSAVSRLKIQEALQRAEQEKAIILNTMPQVVTYHDVSHRILWANRTAIEALGRPPEEIVGRRCYELWDGAAMPCKGCPVDLALRTECSQEAEIIGYNGGTWLVRGEPVRDGNGRLLGVVELALDISRCKRDEQELRRRLQFEELITSISTEFVNLQTDQVGAGIERALAGVGSFVQADRCYVYLLHDGGAGVSKVHEWCADGIDPACDRVRDVETRSLSWALERLKQTGILSIPSARELQGQAVEAGEILESISAKSLLSVPVMIGGQLFGFLGISAVRQERLWPDDAVPLLKMGAEIVASALERKRAADAIRERLAFETLLSELSATFIHLPSDEIDNVTEQWLARIGGLLGIDRCSIVQFSGAKRVVTHSWAAPGFGRTSSTRIDGDFAWSLEQMRRGGFLACARIEDLPAEAWREREYYLQEGMKSILVMPLEVAGSMLGVISFSCMRNQRDWADELIQRLHLVGQIFANAMLRRRAEEALRASETRLKSIVRAAPTGIGLVSDRVLLEVNDRVCEMLGYGREELVNRNARILYPTEAEYEHVGREKYCQIGKRGTGTVETRWLRKDGRIIDVLLSSTPLDLADQSKGVTFAALDITERKRAEQALQESERTLRTLMANLPGLAYRCVNTPEWPFEFVSEGAWALTGYTPEEITIGGVIAYGSLIRPDDQQMVWGIIQDAVLRGASFKLEYRIHTKDGTEKWVFERGTAVPSPHGGPSLLEGFIMDITERKHAEAALRESESRFRDLADLLPQTIFEVDMRGFFTFANRAGLERFGYAEQEAPHVNVLQTVVAADRERAAENIRRRLTGQEVSSSEYTAVCKDGRTFPALLYSAPITREGRLAGIRGIVVDITELKKAEAALRESEQNYREIFDAANDAVLIHDPVTGAILDVNRTMLETYGYTYREALQLRPGAAGSTGSGFSQQEALMQIHKAVEEGPQLFEWLSQKKNGEPIWEEVNLRTAVIGGKRRVLAVVRDITDRKKAEERLQQHLAELTRAWHANTLGEMASGLAHELNQPLCAIVNYSNGCLRLTRKKGYSIETVQDSIEQIAAQAQRAANIVKRIRGLIAKREPQRATLDLESILAGAVYVLKDEAVKHNVTIISRFQASLPKIKGDSVEIEQVVLNLMRNAIEAMNDAQITQRNLTISSCLSDPRRIEIAVTDTGRGIAPELSERIFESFFTTKAHGLGIGLSLSRRIIEAHGGRLWAESDGRSGATFRFTLPIEGDSHGEG